MNIFRVLRQAVAADWHRAFGRAARLSTTPLPPSHLPSQRLPNPRNRRPEPQRKWGSSSPKHFGPDPRISKSTRLTRPRSCQNIADYVIRLQQLIYCFDETQAAVEVRDALQARLAHLIAWEADKIGRIPKSSLADPEGKIGNAISRMERLAGEILDSLDPEAQDGGVPTLPVNLVKQVRGFGDATKEARLVNVTTSLQQAKRDRMLHDTDPVRYRYKPGDAHIADLERQKAALENGDDVLQIRGGIMSDELRALCESGAEEALRNEVILRQLRAVHDPPVVATNEKKFVEWKDRRPERAVVEASEELTTRWKNIQARMEKLQGTRATLLDHSTMAESRKKVLKVEGFLGMHDVETFNRRWGEKRRQNFENIAKAEKQSKSIQDEAMKAGLDPIETEEWYEVDSQIIIFEEHVEDDPSGSIRMDDDDSSRGRKRRHLIGWTQHNSNLALATLEHENYEQGEAARDSSSVRFGDGPSLAWPDLHGTSPTAARKARIADWQMQCDALRIDAEQMRKRRRLSTL